MDIEAVTLDRWYPVAVIDDVRPGELHLTEVLGKRIEFGRTEDGEFTARLAEEPRSPCLTHSGYLTYWISLGNPPSRLFDIPEFAEADRRILGAGSLRVPASGLRTIENFLDMAHFPFVHTGILGAEPNTDVAPYRVEYDAAADELLAYDCRFNQPVAATTARGALDVEYVYRVTSPLVAILYKTCPSEPDRRDVICLFVQPCRQDCCVAHVVLAYIDEVTSDHDLRLFQQNIFGQDLMILANHAPKTLPLYSSMEVPARADAMSVAYRRWLRSSGVVYGACQEAGGEALYG